MISCWGGVLLPRRADQFNQRKEYSAALRLAQSHLVAKEICNREGPPEDVVDDISKVGVKGIIIHERFINGDKVILECTLLMDKGRPCPTYSHKLSHVNAVCNAIEHSKTKPIISQLKNRRGVFLAHNYAAGFPMVQMQPQLPFVSPLQFQCHSQLSQGSINAESQTHAITY